MTTNTTSGVSRRTVAKGAAWTVPVLVTAGALAPDAAASVRCDSNTCFTGVACKTGGSSCSPFTQAYVYYMSTTVPSAQSGCVTVRLDSMTINGKTYSTGDSRLSVKVLNSSCGTPHGDCTGAGACGVQSGYYIQVAPGCTVSWLVYYNDNGNSANGDATISYTGFDSSSCQPLAAFTGRVSTGTNSLPPCGNPSQAPGTPSCP